DVRTLLANERARARRAIECRIAVAPAAVTEGPAAAPALVREAAATAEAIDRHPQNQERERDERPWRSKTLPPARRSAVAGKPAALGLGVPGGDAPAREGQRVPGRDRPRDRGRGRPSVDLSRRDLSRFLHGAGLAGDVV